jgi:hypothetical protein
MTPEEFQAAFLDNLTDADIIRAFVDEMDGVPLEGNFQEATGWDVRIGRQRFPHRRIIARAVVSQLGQQLTPNDFSGAIATRIKWWLGEQGFDTPDL